MANKYACSKCKCTGAKSLIPYKIIEDRNGESIKFVAQLCERCYKEIFEKKDEPPRESEEEIKEEGTD